MIDLKGFGRALASFRLDAGFKTQEAAAAALGIERSRIVKHENGTGGTPQASTLRRYEEGYRLLPGVLMAMLDGEPPPRQNVPESVPRGTSMVSEVGTVYGPPRHLRNLPLAVREYLAEFQLRLVKGGANDEEISEAMDLLRAPQLFVFYKGGASSEYSEEDVLRGIKGIAEGVIVPELRERGRKLK